MQLDSDYLKTLAQQYRIPKGGHPPDRFQERRRAKERTVQTRQWFDLILANPTGIYTYHWQHLGLSRRCSRPDAIFDKESIALWKAKLTDIHPLHHAQLHISPDSGILHVHALAPWDENAPGHKELIDRTPEVVAAYLDRAPFPKINHYQNKD